MLEEKICFREDISDLFLLLHESINNYSERAEFYRKYAVRERLAGFFVIKHLLLFTANCCCQGDGEFSD